MLAALLALQGPAISTVVPTPSNGWHRPASRGDCAWAGWRRMRPVRAALRRVPRPCAEAPTTTVCGRCGHLAVYSSAAFHALGAGLGICVLTWNNQYACAWWHQGISDRGRTVARRCLKDVSGRLNSMHVWQGSRMRCERNLWQRQAAWWPPKGPLQGRTCARPITDASTNLVENREFAFTAFRTLR